MLSSNNLGLPSLAEALLASMCGVRMQCRAPKIVRPGCSLRRSGPIRAAQQSAVSKRVATMLHGCYNNEALELSTHAVDDDGL